MLHKIKTVILRKNKIPLYTHKLLVAFLILILFFLLLGIIQGTLGRFSKSFILSDSASAAKFNVTITPPSEFIFGQGDTVFEYHFLSNTDSKQISFQVHNNSETDVVCTPYLTNNVNFLVFISEEERTDFIVKTKETVSFDLLILPDGLGFNIKNTDIYVDIRQIEV